VSFSYFVHEVQALFLEKIDNLANNHVAKLRSVKKHSPIFRDSL